MAEKLGDGVEQIKEAAADIPGGEQEEDAQNSQQNKQGNKQGNKKGNKRANKQPKNKDQKEGGSREES